MSENNEYCIIYMNTDYKDHQVDNVFIFNIVSHDWELLFFRDKEGTF